MIVLTLLIFASASVKEAMTTGRPYVRLTSDGPVVRDATITFKAELELGEEVALPYYFSWNDDASPRHAFEEQTNSKIAHWNITYGSKPIRYEEGNYTVTVIVYHEGPFWRIKLAENKVNYTLTSHLNGKLVHSQKSINVSHDGHHVVRSTEDTQLIVDFHDPSGFLSNASMQFYWFINTFNYGPTDNDSFTFRFFPPDEYHVEVIVIAQLEGKPLDQNPAVSQLLTY